MNSDKVIIVGDFNVYMDIDDDYLASAFKSLLDSIGFSQRVHEPTHSFNHILDLVITYGVEVDHITVFPQNPVLSDHSLITFEFTLTNYTLPGKKNPTTVDVYLTLLFLGLRSSSWQSLMPHLIAL